MTRIITGLFDNRGDVERTVEHLTQEFGIDPAKVEVHATGAEDAAAAAAAGPTGLERLALPGADRHAYEEAMRRGGILVTAVVPEALADRAMDVFEEYGAADLDEREASMRRAGWTGYTGHDEELGFATYGQDVVVGRVARHHHDDVPAGALGRMELSAARRETKRSRKRVRSYLPGAAQPAAPGGGKAR
jgi:hypothetical protein